MRSLLPFRILGSFALWAIAAPLQADLSSQPGATDSKREKKRLPEEVLIQEERRIPIPLTQKVKVVLGETVEIRLKTLEDPPSQRVDYVIREEPKGGKLSPLERDEGDHAGAIVRYTCDPATTLAADRFTFGANYPEGRVSAPVAVEVQIIVPRAIVELPGLVNFGRTMLGLKSTVQVPVKNTGTAMFEAIPSVLPPWTWTPLPGEDVLRVAPGEQVMATFVFEPKERGAQTFRLELQPGNERGVSRFLAEGFVPFELPAESPVLTVDPRTLNRIGKLQLRSTSPKAVSVRVQGNDRLLIGNGAVWLKEGEATDVSILLKGDPFAYEGDLEVSVPGYSRTVKVRAAAVPAHIEPVAGKGGAILDFGRVIPGQVATQSLFLRNRGGEEGRLSFPVTSPFALAGDQQEIRVPAATEIEVPVWFQPQAPEFYEQNLAVKDGSRDLLFALKGDASPEPVAPPSLVSTGKAMEGPGLAGPGKATGAPPRPSGAASGGSDLAGAAPAPPANETYGQMLARLEREKHRAANLSELTNRAEALKEVPASVRGENGKVALPPTLTRDGLLAYSPFKKLTDVNLPQVSNFGVSESKAHGLKLVWRVPPGGHQDFEVEVRSTRFNPEKKRFECIWFPLQKVDYAVKDEFVYAQIKGLEADSFYLFRVFSKGEGGTNSLPSVEFGARTAGGGGRSGFLAAFLALGAVSGFGALAWYFGQRFRMN